LRGRQRFAVAHRLRRLRARRKVLELELGAREAIAIGICVGKLGLDLLVLDDAALLQVNEPASSPGWQPPLTRILSSGIGSTPLSDAMMIRSSSVTVKARRTKPVAVERRADLAAQSVKAIAPGRPTAPSSRMIFVEARRAASICGVAAQAFGDEHHDGVRQRVAAGDQQL
jgi:hypothetical protein